MSTNISNRKAYIGQIELAFDYNNTREKIEPEKIIYIMIESNYDVNTLPIIYVSVSVDSSLHTKILRHKDNAKFYLNIKKKDKFSGSAIAKEVLSGLFNYIPSSTNPNFKEDLSTSSDNSYSVITLGLISMELTNELRKSFNDIYNGIDSNTLIGLALEGTNCVIEKPTYNDYYNSILVPPVSSRYKFLKFIFDRNAFYDTRFRYFIDFDKSYLLSKKGNPIDGGDGDINSIIIDIRAITEEEAYYSGIETKNGAYYIYINPADSNVVINEGMEKVANQIVSVDEDLGVQYIDLDINKPIDSDTKQMFIRTDNPILYKNELETETIMVEIVKQHIDGSIFTPNKCITVNNYGEYAKYNGRYIMVYKREFFKSVDGEFIMTCNIGLQKVGNIKSSDRVVSSNTKKLSKSTATKTSTANIKNTTRKAEK